MSETAKKKFVYYPGCSSQGSSKHLDRSLRAIVPELGLEMEEIDDWNCCGASVGNIGGGPLPATALSGRNLAKAEEQLAKMDAATRSMVEGQMEKARKMLAALEAGAAFESVVDVVRIEINQGPPRPMGK